MVQVGKKGKPGAKPTPTPKGKLAKGKPTPKASASSSPVTVAENVPYSPPPTASTPIGQPSPAAQKSATGKTAAAPAPSQSAPEAAMAQSVPTPAARAQPVAPDMGTLASTTGGGTWKTFPAGRMPLGRLIGTSDLKEIANQGTGGERIYLKGQFVVNFSDANRAVLRPRGNLTDSVLHFGSAPTRIIVEFPAGYTPPSQGSTVNRDDSAAVGNYAGPEAGRRSAQRLRPRNHAVVVVAAVAAAVPSRLRATPKFPASATVVSRAEASAWRKEMVTATKMDPRRARSFPKLLCRPKFQTF